MMLRAMGRLLLVPLGFLLGILTSLTVLLSLGLERMTQTLHAGLDAIAGWERLFDALQGFYGIITAATIVPVLILIIAGEVVRIRSALFYVIGGGVSLGSLPLLARAGSLGEGLAQAGLVWQVFATAGFAGGLVYWLIAGRSA